MRSTVTASLVLALLSTGCRPGQDPSATHASSAATASAGTSQATSSTTVGGITLQASTVSVTDLNPQIANRYGIDPGKQGILLLLMARDADGNAIDTSSLQLSATASTLPDPPKPLELRKIETDGLTDYIGVLEANPPATAQFRITAINGGARADIATTAELQPR